MADDKIVTKYVMIQPIEKDKIMFNMIPPLKKERTKPLFNYNMKRYVRQVNLITFFPKHAST